MSYLLENNETLSFGLKRIVLELIDRSVFNLAKGNGSFNDDVHDTRKNFKKLRTVLRLIKSELGGKISMQKIYFTGMLAEPYPI
ncbi:MAG: hypothetical protein M5T52_04005 [Ignavibacteriaceae bacterium]|nr:hypothetical protein [Ignavibacteriaceae bacterium]